MHQIFIICVLITPIVSETLSSPLGLEEIPIEQFQSTYDDGEFDHEVYLRPSRTTNNQNDLKEHFFRNFEDDTIEPGREAQELPKPGGFSVLSRNRREITEITSTEKSVESTTDFDNNSFGTGLLNVDTLNPSETDESTLSTSTIIPKDKNENNLIIINDFIRFKRGSSSNNQEENNGNNDESLSENRPKRDRQTIKTSTKLSLENDEINDENNNREPRGLTRQEWVKFPYDIQKNDNELYTGSSSEFVKAPRVHFVTQRRSESVDRPLIYRNERQGRDSDLPREARADVDVREKNPIFSPRYPRRYEPLPPYPDFRYDSRRDDYRGRHYGREFRELDDRRLQPPSSPSFYPGYIGNRQRRIIYYANLPEVTRNPVEDRYRYRQSYDDRRYPIDSYRRKIYEKPRYDDGDRNKIPYPLKVSTDVNVREVKKNPERRIYEDVERKSTYNNRNQDSNRN